MHPCSEGLSDEVVREISEKCELLQSDAGVILHRVNEPITSVYLVIHGRIKQSLIDIRGNVLMERQQVAGHKWVRWRLHRASRLRSKSR